MEGELYHAHCILHALQTSYCYPAYLILQVIWGTHNNAVILDNIHSIWRESCNMHTTYCMLDRHHIVTLHISYCRLYKVPRTMQSYLIIFTVYGGRAVSCTMHIACFTGIILLPCISHTAGYIKYTEHCSHTWQYSQYMEGELYHAHCVLHALQASCCYFAFLILQVI